MFLPPLFVHRPRNNAALVISLGVIRDAENGLYFFVLTVSIVRKIRCRIYAIQNYVGDLHKLREVFHKELEDHRGRAVEGNGPRYAKRCDAALASFMEKASARESEQDPVSGGKA